MSKLFFPYGAKELEHLKKADKKLAAAIEQIGIIEREIIPDLFTALIHSIVSQQISNKARDTVWKRIVSALGEITPATIAKLSVEEIQQFGISFRKAGYIQSATQKIISGELDLNGLHTLSDEEVSAQLTELKGIGQWTAEMLMIFSMQRLNILSYGDLAIQRGMRMLYQKQKIDKAEFNKYYQRYTPYASVASLYLWAIAGGAIEELEDPAAKQK